LANELAKYEPVPPKRRGGNGCLQRTFYGKSLTATVCGASDFELTNFFSGLSKVRIVQPLSLQQHLGGLVERATRRRCRRFKPGSSRRCRGASPLLQWRFRASCWWRTACWLLAGCPVNLHQRGRGAVVGPVGHRPPAVAVGRQRHATGGVAGFVEGEEQLGVAEAGPAVGGRRGRGQIGRDHGFPGHGLGFGFGFVGLAGGQHSAAQQQQKQLTHGRERKSN